MIIGGVNAAGKAGGLRTSLCEFYLPCRVSVFGTALSDMLQQVQKQSLLYQAYIRVRNVADTAWITLGSATSFSVDLTTAQLGTASVTIKQRDVYSPFALTYPDVLRPSNRLVQIWCGLKNYPLPIFEGSIKSYKETVQATGSQINLELEDLRDTMMRMPYTAPETPNMTLYRILTDLIQKARASGSNIGISAGQNVILGQQDASISVGSLTNGTIETIIRALSPGIQLTSLTGNGTFDLSQDDGKSAPHATFTYDDNALLRLEQSAGANAYNYVRTYGLVNGKGVASYVQDDIDVAKRGIIVYPPGYVGSPTIELSGANAIALQMIATQITPQITWEVQLNPYLTTGSYVRLSSVKANLASCIGKMDKINHSYAAGKARTTVSEWRGV